MKTRRRVVVLLAGVALIAAASLGAASALHVGPWSLDESSASPGPLIATVDGRPIYLGMARARIDGLSTVHGDLQGALGRDWQQQVLDSLVDDQLIAEEARARGIVVSDEDVQVHLAKLQEMFPSLQAFSDWLGSQGMDLAELERRIRVQTVASLVYRSVTEDVSVSGRAIRRYYRSHGTAFEGPDGTPTPLLEVRTSIRRQLLKQRRDQAFAGWLDRRRQDAKVVIVMDDWWRRIA